MNWITPLIDDYHKWIKTKTIVTSDPKTGWSAISTPFVGIFNDTLEIYAQKKGDKIILSDNGDTLSNLELLGVKIGKGERKEIAERILLNYGIGFNEDELWAETTEGGFPQKKHNFISAMIELNDMSVLSSHKITTIFKEEVREFLDMQEIIYTPDFISKGTTGIEFTFDFQIAFKNQEIVIKSFNSLNKLNVPSFLFAWEDIKPVREKSTKKEVKAIAIINDFKEIKPEFVEALNQKNADYFLWSEKTQNQNLQKLKLVA